MVTESTSEKLKHVMMVVFIALPLVAVWLVASLAAFASAIRLFLQGLEWPVNGEWVEYSTRQALVYFEIIDRVPEDLSQMAGEACAGIPNIHIHVYAAAHAFAHMGRPDYYSETASREAHSRTFELFNALRS